MSSPLKFRLFMLLLMLVPTSLVAGDTQGNTQPSAASGHASRYTPYPVRRAPQGIHAERYSEAMKWSRQPATQVQAFAAFQKLAKEGHAKSMATLGYCYEKAIGTSKDIHAAKHWYQQAADHGEPEGNWYLYKIYMAGDTGPRDVSQACEELRTALDRKFHKVLQTYNQFCAIGG